MTDRVRANALVEQLAREDIAIATTAQQVGRLQPQQNCDKPASAYARVQMVGDTWGPYGNLDMLERALFIGLRNNFRKDSDLEYALHVCTQGGADVLELQNYGLYEGSYADIVLVEAETIAEAVASRPQRKLVLKRGEPIARYGNALFTAA